MPRSHVSTILRVPSALLIAALLGGCEAEAGEIGPEDHGALAAQALFGTVESPTAAELEDPRVRLGRALFWDERISYDGSTSCASCHTIEAWGSDRRIPPVDARGRGTERVSQTVFNSIGQPSLRWLGDRTDGAHQAERSLTGSMGFARVEEAIESLVAAGYEPLFAQAFPDEPHPLSGETYGRALEAYQRTLRTPAPFDAYLAGDRNALTAEQREGMDLFVSVGCVACHSGPLLGGGSMQRFGIVEDYWVATGSLQVDPGRFAVTGEESDRYVYRVPMLRNVARTGPYFHDGSVAGLGDAIRVMARVQLGRTLTDGEVERIETFLEALTGAVPAHYAPPE